jgi:hypothetical protein
VSNSIQVSHIRDSRTHTGLDPKSTVRLYSQLHLSAAQQTCATCGSASSCYCPLSGLFICDHWGQVLATAAISLLYWTNSSLSRSRTYANRIYLLSVQAEQNTVFFRIKLAHRTETYSGM